MPSEKGNNDIEKDETSPDGVGVGGSKFIGAVKVSDRKP